MNSRRIHVLGVPLDHGAGRRGVGMGPSALRIAGLHDALTRIGHTVADTGDLVVAAPETEPRGEKKARYLPLISRVCAELSERVDGVLREGGFPLVLGGDHSIAIGTISGISRFLRAQAAARPGGAAGPPPQLGVLWFDAHGDINTPETSPSGNIHGMPVACLLGNGPKELTTIGHEGPKFQASMFVQIGLRDLDELEKKLVRESRIRAYTMADIDRRGMANVMEEAITIAADSCDMLHVSFDVDAIDPRVAPGTGTQKMGGLTYREAHLAMEMIADTGKLSSMELVEVNPTLDDQNQTAELAVGLIASALGKRIL